MDYEVIRSDRKTYSVEIREAKMLVRAPLHATNEEINTFLLKHKAWIEKHLQKAQTRQAEMANITPLTIPEFRQLVDKALVVIPARVRHYAPLIGVTYRRITIRNQHTLWGSCSNTGNLNFNCMLMLAPPEVLDSVVVHELCHRKEMNHSQRFYEEVLRVFPDYWQWNKWLKENGSRLLRMMPNYGA
jgi:predicted metal-dependent hydrolase